MCIIADPIFAQSTTAEAHTAVTSHETVTTASYTRFSALLTDGALHHIIGNRPTMNRLHGLDTDTVLISYLDADPQGEVVLDLHLRSRSARLFCNQPELTRLLTHNPRFLGLLEINDIASLMELVKCDSNDSLAMNLMCQAEVLKRLRRTARTAAKLSKPAV